MTNNNVAVAHDHLLHPEHIYIGVMINGNLNSWRVERKGLLDAVGAILAKHGEEHSKEKLHAHCCAMIAHRLAKGDKCWNPRMLEHAVAFLLDANVLQHTEIVVICVLHNKHDIWCGFNVNALQININQDATEQLWQHCTAVSKEMIMAIRKTHPKAFKSIMNILIDHALKQESECSKSHLMQATLH